MAIKFGQDVCYRCGTEVDNLNLIDVCGSRIWICNECEAEAARMLINFIETGHAQRKVNGSAHAEPQRDTGNAGEGQG